MVHAGLLRARPRDGITTPPPQVWTVTSVTRARAASVRFDTSGDGESSSSRVGLAWRRTGFQTSRLTTYDGATITHAHTQRDKDTAQYLNCQPSLLARCRSPPPHTRREASVHGPYHLSIANGPLTTDWAVRRRGLPAHFSFKARHGFPSSPACGLGWLGHPRTQPAAPSPRC